MFRVLGVYNFAAGTKKNTVHLKSKKEGVLQIWKKGQNIMYSLLWGSIAKYNCNFCLKTNIQSHLSLRNEYEREIPALSFCI